MLSHTPKPAIEYRQLISRAITQRLHSPTWPSSLDAWERNERLSAQAKARERLGKLGVTWGASSPGCHNAASVTNHVPDQFVADVERVEGEVHVLTPTRYEGEGANERAVKQNQEIGYVVRDREGGGERREMWCKQVQGLRMFHVARSGGGDAVL